MITVGDFRQLLGEYDQSLPLFNMFDAGGNYYFPEPTLIGGTLRDGSPALVISNGRVDTLETIRSIVHLNEESE